VLALASGAGLVLYAWLWALVPNGDVHAPAAAPGGPVAPATTATAPRPRIPGAPGPPGAPGLSPVRGHVTDIGLGAVLLLAAASVVGARYGWAPPPGVVVPVLVVIIGAVLAYSQLDEVERSRWAARTGAGTRGAVLRVVGGLLVVLVGVLVVVVQPTDVASAGRAL